MHRVSIISLIFLVCIFGHIYCDEDVEEFSSEEFESSSSDPEIEEILYTLELPDYVIIERHNATDYINADNVKHHAMGVANDQCDNGNWSLEVDFDPENQTEIEINTKCYENSYPINDSVMPLITMMEVPKRYMPVHRCMRVYIKYSERIPLIGPHRPLWARYGEYLYLPPQRWLHNIEHGSIVLLYHPCADAKELIQFKTLVKKCLVRHVITPYNKLSKDRPFALLGWAASLEFSHYEFELAKNFIKFYAKSGPERTFRNGQYRHLLIEKAQVVTNVIDSTVCPNL